ncbi:hypothetical protein SLS64_009598 [Diaporthe eres]
MGVTKDTNPSNMLTAPEAPNTLTPENPSTNLDVGELLEARATNDGEAVSNGEAKSDGGGDIAGQVVPTNLLRRLPKEVMKKIYELVMVDGIPGAPDPIPGEEKFTRTLKMPAITMVDRHIRDESLAFVLPGNQFSVQLPRDEDKISRLESLQERVLNRHRGFRTVAADETLEAMKQHAQETRDELSDYFANTKDLNLCPFRLVGSLILTYNGRLRINVDDGTSNWSPRSILVGFRCYDDAGFEAWKGKADKRKQLNADGKIDWTDFRGVRKAFVAALIKSEFWFSYVDYEDVLLHPMIQPIVKALCMFASGQEKPLRWIEVIAFEFISIPTGLGVEWSYLTYEDAVYQSEPDDGFGGFSDGRFLSGDEDSQDSWEKEGSDVEEEDEEDEKSSEDGDNSEGRDDPGDNKSDGDHIN